MIFNTSQIRFKTLKSSLCDYSDVYTLVKRFIINCAPSLIA